MGVFGCPLTPRPTQGGIGAAHGPRKQFSGGTGVSCDPSNNSWRYGGVPLPLKHLTGCIGAFLGPTRKLRDFPRGHVDSLTDGPSHICPVVGRRGRWRLWTQCKWFTRKGRGGRRVALRGTMPMCACDRARPRWQKVPGATGMAVKARTRGYIKPNCTFLPTGAGG